MGMRVTGIGLYIQIERQPQSRPLVLRSMLLMGTPSRALSYRARGNRNGKCAFELISIIVIVLVLLLVHAEALYYNNNNKRY